MTKVKGTVKIDDLFNWSRAFDVDHDEKITRVIYYPDPNIELHIVPNTETVAKLKAIRDELQAIMNRQLTIEGEIIRRRERRLVTGKATDSIKWVDV
jgi:hypothetical protein